MAKTYKDLFPGVYDFEALHNAYCRARRGKRTRPSVLLFEHNLEQNLIELQNELIWGEYRTGSYRYFELFEPKRRQAASLPFKDRVLQHALVAVLEPIWEPRFISDTYACRPGRGLHRGADRAQCLLRRTQRQHGRVFALKADISKYFASIDHAILMRLLRRHVACEPTLTLCEQILSSYSDPNSLAPRGLPIGNLTSQLWAGIYLNELDRYVKHVLHEPAYVRYMDDFVIIHHDKHHLHSLRAQIEDFLDRELRLRTNRKTQVFPIATDHGRALDFLGYRIWPTHRRLRKSSIRRILRSLKRFRRLYAENEISLEQVRASLTAWLAHAEHADTVGLRRKITRAFDLPP